MLVNYYILSINLFLLKYMLQLFKKKKNNTIEQVHYWVIKLVCRMDKFGKILIVLGKTYKHALHMYVYLVKTHYNFPTNMLRN